MDRCKSSAGPLSWKPPDAVEPRGNRIEGTAEQYDGDLAATIARYPAIRPGKLSEQAGET